MSKWRILLIYGEILRKYPKLDWCTCYYNDLTNLLNGHIRDQSHTRSLSVIKKASRSYVNKLYNIHSMRNYFSWEILLNRSHKRNRSIDRWLQSTIQLLIVFLAEKFLAKQQTRSRLSNRDQWETSRFFFSFTPSIYKSFCGINCEWSQKKLG